MASRIAVSGRFRVLVSVLGLMVLGSRDLREREGGELGLHVVFTGLLRLLRSFIAFCGFSIGLYTGLKGSLRAFMGFLEAQRAQYPLIKEYTLNYKRLHIMI